MSIERLFDSRAEVWRPDETVGVAREVVIELEQVDDPTRGSNCTFEVPKMQLVDIGPGETTRGRVLLYMHRRLDVVERDVLRVISGPQAPSRWRVASVARPRDHHVEAMVEPWVGKFPDEAA